MSIIKEYLKEPDVVLREDGRLEEVRDELTATERRSRFILFTTLIAFGVFLGGVGIAYWGIIEALEMRTFLVLVIFLAGAVVIIGTLAGLASMGAFFVVRQLDLIRSRVDLAESMDEMEMMWKVLERLRERAPGIVESVLNEEEVKKELRYYAGLVSRFEEMTKSSEGH